MNVTNPYYLIKLIFGVIQLSLHVIKQTLIWIFKICFGHLIVPMLIDYLDLNYFKFR